MEHARAVWTDIHKEASFKKKARSNLAPTTLLQISSVQKLLAWRGVERFRAAVSTMPPALVAADDDGEGSTAADVGLCGTGRNRGEPARLREPHPGRHKASPGMQEGQIEKLKSEAEAVRVLANRLEDGRKPKDEYTESCPGSGSGWTSLSQKGHHLIMLHYVQSKQNGHCKGEAGSYPADEILNPKLWTSMQKLCTMA